MSGGYLSVFSSEFVPAWSDGVIIMPPFFKYLISFIFSLNISVVLVVSSCCDSEVIMFCIIACVIVVGLFVFLLCSMLLSCVICWEIFCSTSFLFVTVFHSFVLLLSMIC